MSSSSEARAARRAASQRRGADIVGGGHGGSKSKYPEGQDPEKSARKQDKRKMARRGSGFDSDSDGDDGGAEEPPNTSRVASREEQAEDVVEDDNALSPTRMKTMADELNAAAGADTSSAVAKTVPVHPFGAPSVTGILSGACLVSVGTNQRGTTVRLPPGGSVTLGIDFGIMTDDVPAYQCTIGHDGSTWSVTGRDALKPAHVFFSHSLSRTLEPGACVTLAHGNVLVLDSAGAYAFRLETVNDGDSLDAIMQGVDSTNEAVTRAPPRALDASLAAAAVEPGGATSEEAPGWLADPAVVAREVAAAKAQAAADHDTLLSKYEVALGKCGALEAIPKDELKQTDITKVIQGLFSDQSMYQKREKKSKEKSQTRVRPKLVEMIKEATEKRRLAVAKAELDARLRSEEVARAAREAASDDESREERLRSMRESASLMAEADERNLNGRPTGNLGKLLAEIQRAQVALISSVDGVKEKNTNIAIVDRMVRSLDAELAKRSPEEVAETALRSIAAEKLAPRSDREESELLAAAITSSREDHVPRTSLQLGPMPSLDDAELQRLQDAYERVTNAPPSDVASVHFGVLLSSESLGGVTALPSRLPVWDDQPRVMVDARTVATTDSMQEHADSLLRERQIAEGKARAARNRQSGAPEEGSSSAAEEDESKDDESL